jgi:hypothetical protein
MSLHALIVNCHWTFPDIQKSPGKGGESCGVKYAFLDLRQLLCHGQKRKVMHGQVGLMGNAILMIRASEQRAVKVKNVNFLKRLIRRALTD